MKLINRYVKANCIFSSSLRLFLAVLHAKYEIRNGLARRFFCNKLYKFLWSIV
jgi:hypothetical protein